MKLETFFEKFEQFADTPYAVAKMRELILQLAIRGKLLEQDKEEEHADCLLKRAKSEKVRVIKKQDTQLIEQDEEPFSIPESWVWTRLGEIGDWGSGSTPKRGNYDLFGGEITWLKSGELNDNQALAGSVETVTELAIRAGSFRMNRPGDVLIAMYGATIGKAAILAESAVTNQAVCGCTPFEGILNRYLFDFILAQRARFHSASEGGAQPNISKIKIVGFPFPLPPLNEQKRIVAKVDELMALCDRLEAQQQERDTRHASLARASLARFADAPTPANLNFLFHPSYAISPTDLRKTILTLAVQGKLISQDTKDEPVEALLAKIAEKRHAAKAKEYRSIDSDEAPYEIPGSWSWVRLGNVSLKSDSGWSPQCLPENRSGTDWGVLKVSAVSWGVFNASENKALAPGMPGRTECEVHAGDFLLSRANTEELVSRSVVVNQTPPRLMMSDKIVRFTFPDEIEKAFINLVNLSDPSRAYYARKASGTSSSMKNVGREVMCNLPIPLPPLAEQHRIVAKVDQLMAMVDQLEKQLADSHTAAINLMKAVVAELAVQV